jgi:hypothetical protein
MKNNSINDQQQIITGEKEKNPNTVDPTKQDERDNDPTRVRPSVSEPDKNDPNQPETPGVPQPPKPGSEKSEFNTSRIQIKGFRR